MLCLLPPPARGDVCSCWASWVCLFSLSWYTCGCSTRCRAAGGLSGVPLLADSGWPLYSCGVGFAWGWGWFCQLSCSPLFSFFVPAQLPLPLLPLRGSAPLPSGLACLSPVCWSTLRCGWRGLAATFSSVPVCCFPCCRYFGIFWASPALLACWGGWGFVPCQGVPVAVLSAWFAGGVPLLPFPCLRVGVVLAKVSPEFVGYEGGFGCPSWFFILFRCLLVHLLFLELGWFLVTRWWLLLRLLVLVSSDARSHNPETLASSSTPISGSWMVLAPVFSCALPWVRPFRFLCWLLARDDWGFSLGVLPPWLRCGGCYPGSLSGTCWQAIGELLFLWPPGFGAVHSLHVWSPASGPVCVVAQSTIVTLLSLPWLGLLLVFMRFLCLRLPLWASACVGPHGCRPSPGSVLLLQPGFLFSGLVVWGSFHPVPSPLSSFGMWSPFRVISVLCHYWSPTKVSFGW